MTLIIGWKTKSSVFISADSAMTIYDKDFEPKAKQTAFLEKVYKDDDVVVQEGLLKLFNIQNRIIIGFSGINHLAFDLIADFKRRVEFYPSDTINEISELIMQSVDNCLKSGDEVSLIVGININGEPYLLSYGTNNNKEINQHDKFVWTGSIDKYFPQFFKEFAEPLIDRQMDDEHLLVTLNSILQSFSIHHYLLPMGVGGPFFGFRLNGGKVIWQNDTSYFIYSQNIESSRIINIGERENVLIALLAEKGEKNIYGNPLSPCNISKWANKYIDKTAKTFAKGETKYYVFLDTMNYFITILKLDNNFKSKYLSIEPIENNKLLFGLSPKLRNSLFPKFENSKPPFPGAKLFYYNLMT